MIPCTWSAEPGPNGPFPSTQSELGVRGHVPWPAADGTAVVLSRHDGARSAGEVDGPCRRERGATLVEAAIVTPLFFLLIFGIIEVGGAYKDKLAIGNAVTAGARTGQRIG